MTEFCRNCDAPLAGRYCAACGQKAPSEEDRRLMPLLFGFFSELTSIDGRFWRTIKTLLFQPGLLSREYLDGHRLKYVAPVSLFLIANALYFLSPGLSDFDLSLVDQTHQAHSRWTRPLLDTKLAANQLTVETYAPIYAVASSNIGKLLLIVHVPFIALMLYALRSRSRGYYVEHFVVALHLFTFLLLYIQLLAMVGAFSPETLPLEKLLRFLASAAPVVYFVMACRCAYASGRVWALIAGAAAVCALLTCNLYVYRTLQFLIALAIT